MALLAEFEKFLRKLRLISLKIDILTNRLIHKVRKSAVYHEEILSREMETEGEIQIREANANGGSKKGNFREEEQQLIIEIARNPKDAVLYKKLGQIYLKTGNNEDAFESFKKALELKPEDAEAKAKLEKIAIKLSKLPE